MVLYGLLCELTSSFPLIAVVVRGSKYLSTYFAGLFCAYRRLQTHIDSKHRKAFHAPYFTHRTVTRIHLSQGSSGFHSILLRDCRTQISVTFPGLSCRSGENMTHTLTLFANIVSGKLNRGRSSRHSCVVVRGFSGKYEGFQYN